MAGGELKSLENRGPGALPSRLTSRRLTVWGGALLLLSWSLYAHAMLVPGYVDRAGRFKGTDFIQFYVMGSIVADGRAASLYDSSVHLAEGRRRIAPDLQLYAAHVNYGPQVAAAFVPLATLPFGWALALFLALMAACYALSVVLLYRECPGLAGHGRVVAILAAASPLFLTMIRYGQLSAVSLLLMTLVLVALRRSAPLVAGTLLGCLVFKPQLGLVAGVVLMLAGSWRIAGAALASAAAQLALGWMVAGTPAMMDYFGVLWRLARDPSLVQLHPSEVHSLRGFLQLLTSSSAVIGVGALAGMVLALFVGVTAWRTRASVELKWSLIVLLTVLASPHLLTYDLVLLTIPLVILADWGVREKAHPLLAGISGLLILIYLSPFSSNVARLIGVQLSTVAMAALAWCLYRLCTAPAEAGSEWRRVARIG